MRKLLFAAISISWLAPACSQENPRKVITQDDLCKSQGKPMGCVPDAPPGLPPVTPIKLIQESCPPAIFPEESRQLGHSGRVTVRVEVSATGELISAYVAMPSAHAELNAAALDRLSKCRYQPASQNGKPFRSSTVIAQEWIVK